MSVERSCPAEKIGLPPFKSPKDKLIFQLRYGLRPPDTTIRIANQHLKKEMAGVPQVRLHVLFDAVSTAVTGLPMKERRARLEKIARALIGDIQLLYQPGSTSRGRVRIRK